jgi:hypothetical protein
MRIDLGYVPKVLVLDHFGTAPSELCLYLFRWHLGRAKKWNGWPELGLSLSNGSRF